ncbi:hypothetical protein QBC39DRAFT_371541 [Podospora conica]|nr:hypothetical protein QBC39DRAFT_371541 [Schizothecium conicum]
MEIDGLKKELKEMRKELEDRDTIASIANTVTLRLMEEALGAEKNSLRVKFQEEMEEKMKAMGLE